jgi:prevent-host-death family protein
MKIAPVADVKARLSAYLEVCAETPVVVTKNGRPAAVLIAVSDEDELECLVLAHSPRFRAILDAADRKIRKGEIIGHHDFWKTVAERHREADARANRLKAVSKRVRRTSMQVNREFAAVEADPGTTPKKRSRGHESK